MIHNPNIREAYESLCLNKLVNGLAEPFLEPNATGIWSKSHDL